MFKEFKRGLALVLAMVLVAGLWASAGATAQAAENSSTEARIVEGFLAPIEPPVVGSIPISNRAELEAIWDNLDGTYHLTADIDLAGEEWVPIGDRPNWFTGLFDGQGHVIRNMTITGEGYEAIGLFGYVRASYNNTAVKNVGIEDVSIDVAVNDSYVYVGGVFGRDALGVSGGIDVSYWYDTINCYVTGSISVSFSSPDPNTAICSVGGISGYPARVFDSYNIADITVVSDAYHVRAGGISGSTNNVTMRNCYNTGTIQALTTGTTDGYDYGSFPAVGGISGIGNAVNCYNTGSITAKSTKSGSNISAMAGGIVGSGSASDCYNTGNVSAELLSAFAASTYASVRAGGIGASVSANNCLNSGSVSSQSQSPSIPSYSGGIGASYSYAENCVVLSDIISATAGSAKSYLIGSFGAENTTEGVNNLALDTISGNATDDTGDGSGGARITLAEARDISTYRDRLDWDFDTVWKMPKSGGFPIMQWQKTALSEDDAIPISSIEDLLAVHNNLSGSYYLTQDIDLCGLSVIIGTKAAPFTGIFDGRGYWIDRLIIDEPTRDYVGLFGYISEATIKNLNLSGSVLGREYVGSLVGYAFGSTIETCHNTAAVQGDSFVGGIVGYAEDVGGNVPALNKLRYVSNIATVKGNHRVGGIVGRYLGKLGAQNQLLSVFEHCDNEGNVTLLDEYYGSHARGYGYLGGIAGEISAVALKDATNSGTVNVRFAGYAGGIAGWLSAYGQVNSCKNTGFIHGETEAFISGPIGGLVGDAGWSSNGVVSPNYSRIENSTNSGRVYGGGYIGGIVGTLNRRNTVDRCCNTGEVEAKYMVGGIAGSVRDQSVISDCFNTADVLASDYVAQPIGRAYGGTQAGGIVGIMDDQSVVQRCYNVGSVAAIGVEKYDYGKNEYYIDGGNMVGGIVGRALAAFRFDGGIKNNASIAASINGTSYSRAIIGNYGSIDPPTPYEPYIINNFAADDIEGVFGYDADSTLSRGGFYSQSTYDDLNWDFETVWKMPEDDGFPILQWQEDNEPNPGDRTIAFYSPIAGEEKSIAVKWSNKFFDDNAYTYCQDLATISMALCAAAYNESYIRDALKTLGFSESSIQTKNYNDAMNDDKVGFSFAYQDIKNGDEEFRLVAVVIRGTVGREWYGDFDLGTGQNHKSFRIAEEEVYNSLIDYLHGSLGFPDGGSLEYINGEWSSPLNYKFLITGHSRGAAIANLLAADMEQRRHEKIGVTGELSEFQQSPLIDPFWIYNWGEGKAEKIVSQENIYAYTFATPNVTTNIAAKNEALFRNIRNFVNPEDFVPYMPLAVESWGYWKYGTTYAFPSKYVDSVRSYEEYSAKLQYYFGMLTNGTEIQNYQRSGFFTVQGFVRDVYDLAHDADTYLTHSYAIGADGGGSETPRQYFNAIALVLIALEQGIKFIDGVDIMLNISRYTSNAFRPTTFFFINNLDRIRHGHTPETYLSWIQATNETDLVKSANAPKGIFARFACPVDIDVYDSANTLVGRVVNNVVDISIENAVSLYVNEDEKSVILPASERYTFRLTGTDNGTLDYTITEFNILTQENFGTAEFIGVALFDGKSLQSAAGGGISTDNVELFVVENGEKVAKVNPDGTETAITNDAQAVASDKAALTWDVIKGTNTAQNNITSNLTLPTAGASGSTITWESSDSTTVSATGTVTRPAYSTGNKSVTLTATITSGIVSDTLTFTLAVIAQPYTPPYIPPTSTTPPSTTIPDPTPPLAGWDNPYSDVNETDWFFDAVRFVSESDLMNGTGGGKFSPNVTMSRAMLVTVLYRLEEEPDVNGDSPFSDVKNGEWYSNAILWASENGIVDGYNNGAFGLNDPVTREQAVTILYRYAKYKGVDVSAAADLSKHTDMDDISDWALDAMKWAVAVGIVQGRTATTTVPQGTSTRAEVAMIFKRFIEDFLGEGDDSEE